MNYERIYNQLIEKRRKNPINRKEYKKKYPNEPSPEKHHIIPKCIGGSDEEKNLVVLTCKEHFVAHKLLVKIAEKKNDKNALIKLTHSLWWFYNGNQKECKHISKYGKQYVSFKLLNKKIGITEETRNKMKQNWEKRRLIPESIETKNKKSKSHIGLHHSEETKKNMSKAQLERYKQPGEIEKKRKKSKEVSNRPEIKQMRSKISKEYWKNLSEEEYKQRCECYKGENNPMYNKHYIWIHNVENTERKLISKNSPLLENYFKNGWIRGSGLLYKGKSTKCIWISNDKFQVSKLVKKDVVDKFYNDGWFKGRKY